MKKELYSLRLGLDVELWQVASYRFLFEFDLVQVNLPSVLGVLPSTCVVLTDFQWLVCENTNKRE